MSDQLVSAYQGPVHEGDFCVFPSAAPADGEIRLTADIRIDKFQGIHQRFCPPQAARAVFQGKPVRVYA